MNQLLPPGTRVRTTASVGGVDAGTFCTVKPDSDLTGSKEILVDLDRMPDDDDRGGLYLREGEFEVVEHVITEVDRVLKDDPVNPRHYADLGKMAAVYVIPAWELGFELGNTVKYIQRAGKKPGEDEVTDLKKARWYLDRRIHLLDPDNEPDPAA